MAKTKRVCTATYEGHPCIKARGWPDHQFLRVERSGLGLPVLIHQTKEKVRWTMYGVLKNLPEARPDTD